MDWITLIVIVLMTAGFFGIVGWMAIRSRRVAAKKLPPENS